MPSHLGTVDVLVDEGYVLVQQPSTHTGIPCVFAAGDLVGKTYQQALTAAGTGCAAAIDAERWLAEQQVSGTADVAPEHVGGGDGPATNTEAAATGCPFRIGSRQSRTARETNTSGKPVTVDADSFSNEVRSSDKPVLVDFWADSCGPCKMVAPVLEEIADEHQDKITIAKLDIDQNPGIARDYQVMSIPTMLPFSGGEPVKQIVGTKPKAQLLKDLSDYL